MITLKKFKKNNCITNLSLFLKYIFKIYLIIFFSLNIAKNKESESIKLALYSYSELLSPESKDLIDITIPISHQGNLYHLEVSPYFGGQLSIKSSNDITNYYVVISNDIDFSSDNKSLIRGYQTTIKKNEDQKLLTKLYVLKLELSVNQKNDITYNWNIKEIPLKGTSLPENAIIIYSDPNLISLESFDPSFDANYPASSKNFIIFPQIKIHEEAFKHTLSYNNLSIHAGYNHAKIENKCR